MFFTVGLLFNAAFFFILLMFYVYYLQTLMNVIPAHAIIMPVVLTTKVLLPVNAILDFPEMD